jgi:hypothetical protein
MPRSSDKTVPSEYQGTGYQQSHHAICSLIAEVKGKPEKVVLKGAWIVEVGSSDAELGGRGIA